MKFTKGYTPYNKGKYASLERFWKFVDKTESCWIWLQFKDKLGYGCFHVNGRTWLAHRFAWVLTRGAIPAGMEVCHSCDNPSCVRPEHLYLGTQADNIQDCKRKGRIARGFQRWNTKLTDIEVDEIRRMYVLGLVTHVQLAKNYKVSPTHVGRILRGERREIAEQAA